MTMITLCLTFAPERKKIEIDDTTTTLEQLYDIVRTAFGISANVNDISLRHGYPSVALPKLNGGKKNDNGSDDNKKKKSKSLSDSNIRNQDRIIVSVSTSTTVTVPATSTSTTTTSTTSKSSATNTAAADSSVSVVKQQPRQKENKKPLPSARASIPSSSSTSSRGSSSKKGIIPGLTKNHYVKDSRNAVGTPPICISSQVENSTNSFEFRWKAIGSNGSSFYQLSAEGNLSAGRLIVKCTCPAFTKMGPRNAAATATSIPVKVCKHLSAALDNALDPNGGGNGNIKSKDVVDLLSDDSDTDVEEVKETTSGGGRQQQLLNPYSNNAKKRIASEPTATDTATAKQPTVKKIKKLHSFQSTTSSSSSTTSRGTAAIESPIKLLATPSDLLLRRSISDKSHGCWSQCQSLQELVFGGGNTNDPTTSIQWMVISNYLIDFNYLQHQLPEILTIPKAVIVHSQHVPSPRKWPNSIDIIQRNPGADAKSTMNPLQYKFDYGTHHTKLFLVGYKHKIRVVVSTANLRPDDCQKAQAMYVEEFPLASNDNETSDFEETLIHYISSYGYDKKRNWLGGTTTSCRRESLTDVLARYDYSSAKAVLIPSIPGYHSIDNRTPRVGQLKVRESIQKYTSTSSRSSSTPRPVICQFSSIGTLSDKYLHSLQTSMDTCLARSERKGQSLQLKFVYPTAEEIRTSVEGYRGGDSVPGRKKCVSKPLLRPFWYKWAGNRGGSNNSTNPLTKPNNVPHIKTYYQTNATNDGFDWLVITSHNISQTAWGTIGDNRHGGGQRLYVRSWELGVFVSPQTLGVDKLVVWSGPGNKLGETGSTATIPMPYATHSLERYDSSDQPWACDEHYLIPDRFGFRSCMGY